MRIKRITAIVLTLVLVFMLAACGSSSTTDSSSTPAANAPAADTPAANTPAANTPAANAPASTAPASTAPASTEPAPANAPTFSFTYATSNSAESPTYLTIEKPFLDRIREKSGGRVEFVEYVGGSLLGAGAVYNGVMDGVVDMGFDMPANVAGQFPVTALLEQSGQGTLNATSGAAVSYEFITQFAPTLSEYDGMRVLWMADAGPATLTGPAAIRTLGDIKGKQIRTNAVYNVAIERLGGTAVIMNMSDVYEAFSTNMIDSGWFVADAMLSFSLHEVANYSTIWPFNHSMIFCVIAQDTLQALPADLQQVFEEAAVWLYEEVLLGIIDNNRESSLARAQSENTKLEIINLSADDLATITETLAPLFDESAKKLDEQGLGGTELMNWIIDRAAYYNSIYS